VQEQPNDDDQAPVPDEPLAAEENGPDVEEQVIEEEAAGEAEFADDDPDSPDEDAIGDTTQAVLWASDWTTETILAQLRRGNIELSPRFQRRDAWSRPNKSRFIESLLLGLPVPQIVLAERTHNRGQYIVLDGKQRLLTLLHYSGAGEGKDVGFRLSGLEVRKDLSRVSYKRLSERPQLQNEFNTFASQTIRAVVIRNWPSTSFLHLVFRRLNTGSLKLSAQELRQAISPGPFSDFVDDFSVESERLQSLLGRTTPDPRMRDVELLARHLSLKLRTADYFGRMKEFLDQSATAFNQAWAQQEPAIREAANQFIEAITVLMEILGDRLARKEGSKLFNRSIFDALAFYAVDPAVRNAMGANGQQVQNAYDQVIANEDFKKAVESDTAGVPNTVTRLRLWGEALNQALGTNLAVPDNVENRIAF
jgi:hypothetical protein